MATDFDPYAILQVERSAGQDEIDQAYRRQWAAYPNDPAPEVRLRELQAAYRILSDPEERRAYDSRLAERGGDSLPLTAPVAPGHTLTEALGHRIGGWRQAGYSVVAQSASRTELVGRNRVGWAWLIGVLFFGIGAIAYYVVFEFLRSERLVRLQISDTGQVEEGSWYRRHGSPPRVNESTVAARSEQLIAHGYTVVDDSGSRVELFVRKQFAWGWALFWLALGGFPIIDYLVYHWSRRYQLVTLVADEQGRSVEYNWHSGTLQGEIIWPPVAIDPPRRVPWGPKQVVQAILVVIGGVVLASIPIFLLAEAIAGDAEIDEDPEALALTYLASAFFQVAALGAVWWFSVRKFRLNWGALGLRRPERGMPWLPFSLVATSLLGVGLYGVFIDAIGIHPDTDLPDAAYDSALPLAVILLLTIVIAPVVEEIFFRGFIFSGLTRRWGPIWGALGSATLFGIAHVGNPGYFYLVPPIALIGALFAWGYYHSKSILPSIAAHFMFNLIQIIGALAAR